MGVIFFGSALLFLIASLFFWFWDGFGRSFRNPARRVGAWLSLIALTGAMILFVKFLWMVESPAYLGLSLEQRVEATRSIVRSGFWLTVAAFGSCWFATFKTAICVTISSVAMFILWAAAAII